MSVSSSSFTPVNPGSGIPLTADDLILNAPGTVFTLACSGSVSIRFAGTITYAPDSADTVDITVTLKIYNAAVPSSTLNVSLPVTLTVGDTRTSVGFMAVQSVTDIAAGSYLSQVCLSALSDVSVVANGQLSILITA